MLSFKQLHGYSPRCPTNSSGPPKCPQDRWWITAQLALFMMLDEDSAIFAGVGTVNCQILAGCNFIYLYLDDLFPAEAPKDGAK